MGNRGDIARELARGILSGAGLRVRALGRGAWLVQRTPGRLSVRPFGPSERAAALVSDDSQRRSRRHLFLRSAAGFLGEEHLGWVLDRTRTNVVLDVGANAGQFGTRLRSSGYRGRIVSFEPVPAVAADLRRAAADDPEWHVHECALGEEDAESEINVPSGTPMSSLLTPSDFGRDWKPELGKAHREPIRIRRLDGVLDEVTAGIEDPRVFLKMDTQGYELAVFRGAGDRARELMGLQAETSFLPLYEGMPTFAEQLAAYEGAGFATSGIFVVNHHAKSLRAIEFDLVMVRDGKRPGA